MQTYAYTDTYSHTHTRTRALTWIHNQIHTFALILIFALIPVAGLTLKLTLAFILIFTHSYTYTPYIHLDSAQTRDHILTPSLRLTRSKVIQILIDICDLIHIYLRTITRFHLEIQSYTDIHVPTHAQTRTHIQICIYTHIYNFSHPNSQLNSYSLSWSYSYVICTLAHIVMLLLKSHSDSHLLILTFLPIHTHSF